MDVGQKECSGVGGNSNGGDLDDPKMYPHKTSSKANEGKEDVGSIKKDEDVNGRELQ